MSQSGIQSLKHGKTHIVKFTPPNGVILPSDFPEISKHLEDLVIGNESPEFLLNFEEVQGFDGELVDILTRLRRDIRERGGKLALVGLANSLHSVFEIAGVASLFLFCQNESEAVQAIAETGSTQTLLKGKVDWSSEFRGDAVIVDIKTPRLNEYDLVNDLADGLKDFVDEINARNVLLNFQRVDFMTSSMLGRLLQLRNHLEKRGGKLMLVGLSASIRQVFETTRLSGFFSFHNTVEAALEDV
ncbi:MAG: STAS domain-containing protein [Planctomycetota bacterium]|nr:STAS domain-containing protein [Planctomycetota bacterium]MDA1137932.1 STAS domain-containing protein [Planctomycetota bacterium]